MTKTHSAFSFTMLATCASIGMIPGIAMAQSAPERGATVTETKHPAYESQGIRAGGFVVTPSIEAGILYDTNIYATDTDEKSATTAIVAPAVKVKSDWNNHALNFDASAEIGRYNQHSSENYEDYRVGIDGRVDISRETKLNLAASHIKDHEERGSADDANGSKPTETSTDAATISLSHSVGRLSTKLSLGAQDLEFDNVSTSAGVPVNNHDRNRKITEGQLRADYEFSPGYSAFFSGALNKRAYDDAVDDNGFNRDSDGYRLRMGARIDLTGLVFADVYAGYLKQDYDDAALSTVKGGQFGVAGTWNATPLTSVKVNLGRSINETTVNGASATFDTAFSAKVDHELMRNLLLNGSLGYTKSDFEGITREDKTWNAGIGASYKMNPNMHLLADYTFKTRDSNVALTDYDRNQLMLKLKFQM
ncbi:MAG TPA: hypothetical protein DCW68_01470 [Rhodospirillaceae bacterium]|nr:MAG: hypothetical protein A2018_04435 [Alphaproteobacteria bacterium GWF2_58_20]HAU28767.1 hypothetical protein [Rhodospirillaceae bacterium]